MEGTIYLLCAATALACSVLLLRGWLRRRVPLLLSCGVFFLALFVENMILFVDVVLVPTIDLSLIRRIVACASILLLLFSLIWDTK